MNTATLLHQMCHDCLSQADINAIGKSRGFTAAEISTRSTLENFYLSPTGVAQTMEQLSPDEIALLHLLHLLNEPVAIAFFERLYNPDYQPPRYSALTYSQRYQTVFKQARDRLVRRGILLMAEYHLGGDTKMERWRFHFPAEFLPYLPSPLDDIKRLETPGDVRRDVPRRKLLGLVGQAPTPSPRLAEYELTMQNGRIVTGERPFRATDLQKWQKAAWHAVLPTGAQQEITPPQTGKVYLSVLDALTYLLQLLQPGEWVAPAQLTNALKLFSGYALDTDDLCRLGWQWGYLAQNKVDGRAYYRLADLAPADESVEAPAAYLSALDDQTALVNVKTIPYLALEQLNQVAHLDIRDQQLLATPDLIRMGNAFPSLAESLPVQWLTRHIPAFAQTWQVAQKRWGKQIIHTNLFIACVKDLALRVLLERGLKADELVTLSDEYVAFPPKAFSKVICRLHQFPTLFPRKLYSIPGGRL
jgi:hypothetical protein